MGGCLVAFPAITVNGRDTRVSTYGLTIVPKTMVPPVHSLAVPSGPRVDVPVGAGVAVCPVPAPSVDVPAGAGEVAPVVAAVVAGGVAASFFACEQPASTATSTNAVN